MVAISAANMNFEKFISEQKHPAEKPTEAKRAETRELVGREKVIKIFKKTRPEAADVFLLPHGL